MKQNFKKRLKTLLLLLFSLSCATNAEILKKSDQPIANIIGKPIYFLSLKEYGKVYFLHLAEDGTFTTDLKTFSNCEQKWDINERNNNEVYAICNNYYTNFQLNSSKKGWGSKPPQMYKSIFENKGIDFFHINAPHQYSKIDEDIKSKGKDSKMFFFVGEDNLKKFNEFISNYIKLKELEEVKLANGYKSDDTLDLRSKVILEDYFLFIHINVLDDPDLQFKSTPQNTRLSLSDFKHNHNVLQWVKSIKYIIFEMDAIKSPYDSSKKGFTLNIEDNYSGGFKRIYSSPIFIKMDLEKFESIKDYNKVVFIANYDVITKSEKAYVSSKMSGVLNETLYKDFKITNPEEVPFLSEKIIKFKQVKLKILNFKIYNPESGESYWKQ
jgi:hypothetical protein